MWAAGGHLILYRLENEPSHQVHAWSACSFPWLGSTLSLLRGAGLQPELNFCARRLLGQVLQHTQTSAEFGDNDRHWRTSHLLVQTEGGHQLMTCTSSVRMQTELFPTWASQDAVNLAERLAVDEI